MKYVSIPCGLLLLAFGFFSWGLASGKLGVFPYPVIAPFAKELYDFVVSHPDEPALTTLEKLESDDGGIPYRFLQREALDFVPPPDATKFVVEEFGVLMHGYHASDVPPGYILVFGAFNFEDDRNVGIILISTHGKYIGGWPHRQKTDVNPSIDLRRKRILISGMNSVPWGCLIEDLDREIDVYEFGEGHHGVSIAPDGTYWTNIDYDLVQYDPENVNTNGHFAKLRRIGLADDLLTHNPDISPISARFSINWDGDLDPLKIRPIVGLLDDPFHNNDVEPIESERFPTEFGYALLVSVREQNLIMVIDPATKKILWYRQGLTERQHDPDFFEDGIYVYNNRTFSGHSRIDFIPFETDNSANSGLRTIIDGSLYGWFDPSRGQHSVFARNNSRYHLVVNDRNGRVLLFDSEGRILFEVVNILSGQTDQRNRLQLRAALYID